MSSGFVSHNYIPTWQAWSGLTPESPPRRVLLVSPQLVDPESEAPFRWLPLGAAHEAALSRGAYWRELGSNWDLMLVTDGDVARRELDRTVEDDPDSLPVVGFEWFDAWWEGAEGFGPPQFQTGAELVYQPRGTTVLVQGRQPRAGGWSYTVFDQGLRTVVSEDSLRAIGTSSDPIDWVAQEPMDAEAFGAVLTHEKITNGLTDTLFSYGASKTTFRGYQFKPVLRFLESSAERILIADEVGLGKTISAGLLWTELAARGQADRVLVVVPSNLVDKWITEMGNRFNLDLELLDRVGLAKMVKHLEEGRAPHRFQFIASIEGMRMFDRMEQLTALQFAVDFVIIDEAHQMRNRDSKSYQLGEHLSDWTSAMALLSATPINLGQSDLLSLTRLLLPGEVQSQQDLDQRLDHQVHLNRIAASLLDPSVTNSQRSEWLDEVASSQMGPALQKRDAFAALRHALAAPALDPGQIPDVRHACAQLSGLSAVLTRTRKAEVQETRPLREVKSIEVGWSEIERDFYDRFLTWARDICVRDGKPLGFAMQMPLRQAGSCLPATALQVLRRDGQEWVDEDKSSQERSTSQLDEEPAPPDLLRAARSVQGIDSKLDALLPELERARDAGKQVLLFTFSRRTLAYLERRFRGRFRFASLHGGIAPASRGEVMRRFRAGEFDLLLATRVASEGLDFEFCSVVINYDLPWNPMEVEQRIGRIDRIGQEEKKIQIWNFSTPETIETRIVERLMERIGVFTDTIGELEPIVLDQFKKTLDGLLNFGLSSTEQARELERRAAALEQQMSDHRRLQEQAGRLQSGESLGIEEVEARIQRGRYVSAQELADYVGHWLQQVGGTAERSENGHILRVRLSQDALHAVVAWRREFNQTGVEVSRVENSGRHGESLEIVLDQEVARTRGGTLLNVNHPLVQTGIHKGIRGDARFGALSIPSTAEVPPGAYLVLLATARWHGLRKSAEIWTEAVRLSDGEVVGDGVGALVLAGLASRTWAPAASGFGALQTAVEAAYSSLLERRVTFGRDRQRENDALIQERLLRAEAVLESKKRDVRTRLEKAEGRMFAAFQGQIRAAEARHADQVDLIESTRASGLDLAPLAICVVKVK